MKILDDYFVEEKLQQPAMLSRHATSHQDGVSADVKFYGECKMSSDIFTLGLRLWAKNNDKMQHI